jgi:hypothetical protein
MKTNSRVRSGGLIIDGVTGAGKTQTIRNLRNSPDFASMQFIDEDSILGDVMEHIDDPTRDNRAKWAPLFRVLDQIDSKPVRYLLERFHPSFFALVPDWDLFQGVDRALARMNFRVVLLHYDEEAISKRGLNREDRLGTGWIEGMKRSYGGEAAAVKAISVSQRRRFDCADKSELPSLAIDTTDMEWPRYAEAIAAFMRDGR